MRAFATAALAAFALTAIPGPPVGAALAAGAAPAAGATKTLSVAGVSFLPRFSDSDAAANSSGALGGNGAFTAPLPLPGGSVVLGLTIVAEAPAPAGSATLTLYRIDTTVYSLVNPEPVASLAVNGPTAAPVTRSVAPAPIAIDTDRYYYFLMVEQQGGSLTHGVRVDYQDPAPGPGDLSIAVAGEAFDPEVSGVDLKTGSKGALLYVGNAPSARFVAPIRLPQGAVVTRITTTALDDGDFDATMRLLRVPRLSAGSQVMATVSTSGSVIDIPRTFTSTSIASPAIDNDAAFYYLEVETPAWIDIYGIRIDYTPPAVPPVYDADSLAALPFLPERTGIDARAPLAGALRGRTRFDLGLALPPGEQVMSLLMAVSDNSALGDIAATLYRLDDTVAAAPILMATLSSVGAAAGVRTFSSGTLLGRAVDNGRYFYFVRFEIGAGAISANGLVVETRPCGDLDGDGYDGCVDDCDDGRAAVHPAAAEICDGVVDDCLHAAWPDPAGTIEADDDHDGFSECAGDCADADPSRWSPPGEATGLGVTFDIATGLTTLTWSPPANPGGTAAPVYDTLLSPSPSDFQAAGVCAESGGTDTTTTLAGPALQPGQGLYFLVRAQGACGTGAAGFTGSGAPIAARACP